MRTIIGTCALIGMFFVLAGVVFSAQDKTAAPAPLCPVMGGPIDKGMSIDYSGGKLYFCCKGCISKFKANEAKYAARANLQLVATGQARQVACPLTGGKLDPQQVLKVSGIKVAFCCGACPIKVAKAGAAEQLQMIFGKGFEKGFVVKKK